MAYNIGLNVIEVDGVGSPAIVGASTSVAAFNVTTQRGPINTPTAVTSFPQFVSRFGSYFPNSLGAYLVKGFFDNGGQRAYINRVVSSDSATGALSAAMTLKDTASPAADALKLNAGYRGVDDPGTWGNGLYVSVAANSEPAVALREIKAASITGTALGNTVDMTGVPSLSVTVDGESSATSLTFRAADFPGGLNAATPAQIRDAINRQTTKLVASVASNALVLTSTGSTARMNRDFSRIQVSTANATLGLTSTTVVVGTPSTLAATGAQLADVSLFAVGDVLRLSDGTNNAFTKLMTINPVTGDVTWKSVSTFASFDTTKLRISRVTFNLTIAYGGNDVAHIVETWNGLSMEPDVANYVTHVLNDKVTGSKYVVAAEVNRADIGTDVPAAVSFAPFTPGRDGAATPNDFVGDQAKRSGFYAFDAFDVQLVTCERGDPTVTRAGLDYCAGRGDCMYFGAVPQGFVQAGQAIAYGQAFQGKKVYGALYGPWIVVADPVGIGDTPVKTLPPVGHVMGVCARIANSRGIWKSPAGDEANIIGAIDVETRLSDADHTALVKQGSVNGIRAVPRSGVIVDASRTLSTDTRWLYVNVRLLFNYVKSSLKDGLRWVRQEPNRDTLWDAIRIQTVTPFLMGLWRQGAFGIGSAAQVFTVICDQSNNPQDQVDQGNLTVAVYFYPSKPAETIVIFVGQQPSGATTSES